MFISFAQPTNIIINKDLPQTQHVFLGDLATELNINASQLVQICASAGSIRLATQICNAIGFLHIAKKVALLKDSSLLKETKK